MSPQIRGGCRAFLLAFGGFDVEEHDDFNGLTLSLYP